MGIAGYRTHLADGGFTPCGYLRLVSCMVGHTELGQNTLRLRQHCNRRQQKPLPAPASLQICPQRYATAMRCQRGVPAPMFGHIHLSSAALRDITVRIVRASCCPTGK